MTSKHPARLSIGSLIENELRHQERSITWFARHLACDRRNIYRIFRKETLDTALLMRISVILKHDFFADISASIEEHATNMETQPCPKASHESAL
ncbi:MAG: XRE family transcriptional regulator [Alistipes sp.]|nr:XRE family transcriptional regulator [Alistipes sp.]